MKNKIEILNQDGSLMLLLDSGISDYNSLLGCVHSHLNGEFSLSYKNRGNNTVEYITDEPSFKAYLEIHEASSLPIYLSPKGKSNTEEEKDQNSETLEVEILEPYEHSKTEQVEIKPPNVYLQDHSETIERLKENGYLNEEILAEKISTRLRDTIESKFNELASLMKPNPKNPYDDMTSSFNLLKNINNDQMDDKLLKPVEQVNPKSRYTHEFKADSSLIPEESKESIRKGSFESYEFAKNRVAQSMYDIKPKEFNEAPIFSTLCSLCSEEIVKNKYQCLICLDLYLCQACEPMHEHPMVKYKDKDLARLEDCMIFMEAFKKERAVVKRYLDVSIFDKKYRIRLEVLSNSFAMRPNKRLPLSVCVSNELKTEIPGGLIILARNTRDLKVGSYMTRSALKGKESFEIDLEIASSSRLGRYDFELICFNRTVRVDLEPVKIQLDVNEDLEEEKINEELALFNKLLSLPKPIKKSVYRIIKEGLSDKHPYVIYEVLKRCDNSLDLALNALLNMGENQNSVEAIGKTKS